MKQTWDNLPVGVQKTLKSILIGGLGILATFLEEQIPNVNFGIYTPYMVALNSVIVASIKAFLLTK